MKFNINTLVKTITSIVLLCSFTATAMSAGLSSRSDRAERWEFSFQTRYLDDLKVDFENGANANLNDQIGWAFGLGYNMDEHWELNFDIGWSDANYSGTRIDDAGDPESVSGRLYTSSTNFSAVYNFSAKRFTPFIGASMGWTFVDTNIPDGPPQTGCWWDPWWGYICSGYYPTKTTTEFNYGAVLGLRFDINDKLFLKTSVGQQWIDFYKATSQSDFVVYRVDIGVMF